ncbi:MAG: serine hydrolase domain-containing protein [Acidobacteriota bacterium]
MPWRHHLGRSLIVSCSLLISGSAFASNDAVPAASATPESVGMSSERLERLNSALVGYVARGELPGAVALVARRGKVVYFNNVGYSELENKTALEKDSIFRIASQTKALVSTAILMLQEEGKLLISHPLHRYLPAFKDHKVAVPVEGGTYALVPAKRAVTLRDLLTHTSGVSYGNGPAADRWAEAEIQGWYFAHRDEPIQDTINRMAALPFDAHPGEKYIYGYSTDILGAVVEVASGKTLDAFLRERLFEPLGMTDTHFYLPKSKASRLVTVYAASPEGLVRSPDTSTMIGQGEYVDGPRKSFSGGAGLVSTAHDYARFLLAMENDGELDGHRILTPKTVQLMTSNHVGDLFGWGPGTGFGLGFSIALDLGARGTPGTEGEFAWGGAYHTSYWVDPVEELVVVYMTQVIPAGDIDDHAMVRNLVYSAMVESNVP